MTARRRRIRIQPLAASIDFNGSLFPFTDREWVDLVAQLRMPPRQATVAEHVLHGSADKEIAQAMGLDVSTVRTHLGHLFHRFDVEDRQQLSLLFVKVERQLHPRSAVAPSA